MTLCTEASAGGYAKLQSGRLKCHSRPAAGMQNALGESLQTCFTRRNQDGCGVSRCAPYIFRSGYRAHASSLPKHAQAAKISSQRRPRRFRRCRASGEFHLEHRRDLSCALDAEAPGRQAAVCSRGLFGRQRTHCPSLPSPSVHCVVEAARSRASIAAAAQAEPEGRGVMRCCSI